ncbi:NADPH-dependent F420 reductase [Methanoplanus limicola]|uniref:Reduced coenzyme F420:NADP oxidoreductase n=1 Tax=Methanoplanus limicola DSM 2279 TaxID=937775 RepID=H1YZ19_9EURY|nr:NADPH-dependent F420 reductase [Methanoplanus limicola]EHQ34248.1 reduced coenzyme F420:NADP oxidoreductase [Methanoplanus limicola DSM 2279]
MRIGIVGGTGDIGEGLAHRLSHEHEIIIGSREKDKACTMSKSLTDNLAEKGVLDAKCAGATNQEAVDNGDIVILSVNYKHLESTLAGLTGFEDKIVITPVNPISKKDHFYFDPPAEGSAALEIKRLLPESSRIVAAFNNISAQKWKRLSEKLDYSVVVCSDDEDAKKTVMELVNSISELKALDGGPLEMSSVVESLTPLILNIAKYNNMKDVGIKFF